MTDLGGWARRTKVRCEVRLTSDTIRYYYDQQGNGIFYADLNNDFSAKSGFSPTSDENPVNFYDGSGNRLPQGQAGAQHPYFICELVPQQFADQIIAL